MTEQQYTCPFCKKDYTRFTIHEHYGCGVEPLENAGNPIEYHPHAITLAVPPVLGTEDCDAIIAKAENWLNEKELGKPAPKKRGPKPKAKA